MVNSMKRGASDPSDPLVSTDWLADRLGDPRTVVLDCSWFMPGGRDAQAEFQEEHIPGAQFFDIDDIADPDTDLPHMLPGPRRFAEKVSNLGVSNNSTVVLYDTGGFHPAARGWWMFRAMGHDKAFVLDGGLPAWKAAGLSTERGPAPAGGGDFKAHFKEPLVVDRAAVRKAIENKNAAILDARSPGRFRGAEKEPRKGVRPGHMPGAKNLHYAELFDGAGHYRPLPELKSLVSQRLGNNPGHVITTCGSGVTACVLAFTLERLGIRPVRVYDGSWVDWGSATDTPVETNKAEKIS